MISKLLGKYTIPLIAILGFSLLGSGYYIQFLIKSNAKLEASNRVKDEQIILIGDRLRSQEERFKNTLKTLELREEEIKKIEYNNSNLKQKLREIASDENDPCINTNHPESITNLLRDNKVPGETSPSVSP